MDSIRPVQLSESGDTLLLLDQRRLPEREVWLKLDRLEDIADAIETMAVRGAPAIACAAALGLAAVAARTSESVTLDEFRRYMADACARLEHTRPTAVNLFVAVEQIRRVLQGPASSVAQLEAEIRRVASGHVEDDLRSCLAMAAHGASLLPDEGGILTHCNAGALATAGYGTALGVIRKAHAMGKRIRVLADETRPRLQGARLTAWELRRDGVPVEVICDHMAGPLMAAGVIRAAIVGADRIVRNGDVANKIGTYTVAVLCKHHGIPFYVAAPWTTIDLDLPDGSKIPIEQRDPEEVRCHGGQRMTPEDIPVQNPAFDVTPASLVTAIITERGVFRPGELAEGRSVP